MLANSINGVPGQWIESQGRYFFVDSARQKIVIPEQYKGMTIDDLALQNIVSPEPDSTNLQKLQLIKTLLAANIACYERLQAYLNDVFYAITWVIEYSAEVSQFQRLTEFLQRYTPVDPKMQIVLQKFAQSNSEILASLGKLISQTGQSDNTTFNNVMKMPKKDNPINTQKFGLYRFPFLQKEKLYLGDVENYPTIPQQWNMIGLHWKLWKNVNGLPFLVNGYNNEVISVVNRIVASQAAKLLGLRTEEVFFGYLHGKIVTLTAFVESVTILENQVLELYPLVSNYNYLADQKEAFYFLIQHWQSYVNIDGNTKERFDAHYIDSNGEVFLSNHQSAMFLTPQMMAKNLMVKLEINALNYRPIKDMIRRVGSKDLADIVFSSLPDELIELHDITAKKLNQTLIEQKRQCFSTNWERLLEATQQFETMKVS